MRRTNLGNIALALGCLAGSLLFAAVPARAAEEPAPMPFRVDAGSVPSVQRGARDFMNYCSGCHSLKYLRYGRLAQDNQIPDDILKKNLMFTSDKRGDTIVSAMPANAKDWFGQMPPDLSLETKYRGADWVYTYLQSFYLDPTRPTGVNNTMLPGVSMPDVLGSLQGWQVKTVPVKNAESGEDAQAFQLVQPGTMTPDEYRGFVTDLTNFLAYASEPSQGDRVHYGGRVLVYLFVFLILCYLLKKEFWRDVH